MDGERLDLEDLAERALALLTEAANVEDETAVGRLLHWAHVLKSEQGADGAWPARVNARTGEPVSPERTYAPAVLLERLASKLDTTEFDAATGLSRAAP